MFTVLSSIIWSGAWIVFDCLTRVFLYCPLIALRHHHTSRSQRIHAVLMTDARMFHPVSTSFQGFSMACYCHLQSRIRCIASPLMQHMIHTKLSRLNEPTELFSVSRSPWHTLSGNRIKRKLFVELCLPPTIQSLPPNELTHKTNWLESSLSMWRNTTHRVKGKTFQTK